MSGRELPAIWTIRLPLDDFCSPSTPPRAHLHVCTHRTHASSETTFNQEYHDVRLIKVPEPSVRADVFLIFFFFFFFAGRRLAQRADKQRLRTAGFNDFDVDIQNFLGIM